MEKDISSLAQQMLGEDGSKAISGKSSELERLANSPDGQKVKQMLDSSGGIENALSSGDAESLKKALGHFHQPGILPKRLDGPIEELRALIRP